jgi:CheY-like chemotaxis protein
MEAVGRLAGGVAHDFNNLLMITSANLELLEKAKQDPQRIDRYLKQIRIATDRSSALTRQMLAFSRQQVLSPTVLNLNTVINDLWKMLARLLGEDIETILSLDPALGCVSADRGQVEQVVMNLAVNARDAMPHGGKLTVKTRNVEVNASTVPGGVAEAPSGPCVLLSVSDSGVGMSPAVQAQIFDPFFTTKEMGKGTGLGLATVYGIVKQSSGTISVDSEPGKGSTFRVYFPRVKEMEREAEPAPPSEPEPVGSGTILLVEDETPLRQVTSEFLRARGYQVLGAENGEVALEICKSHTGPIDLLITDVVMPGHSGPAVSRQVTEMRPGVRTIFMSGYTDRTMGPDILGPNDAFFQKPFNLQVLARKIHAMLIREN